MIKKIALFLLKWINIPLAIVTVMAYLIPYISPNTFWGLSLLGLGYPFLLLANILCVIAFGLLRSKMVLLPLFCILIGWGYMTNFLTLNGTSSTTESTLKVMSYNVRRFDFSNIKAKNTTERKASIDKALSIINKHQPNVLCGQEFFQFDKNKHPVYTHLLESVKQKYPYFEVVGSRAILSKYPIINKGFFKNDVPYTFCIWVDIQINNETIFRIYNAHLTSNKISPMTESLELNEETIKDKKTVTSIKQILRNYRNTVKIRGAEAEEIVEHIKGSPYPVMVCGDMNDPILSYAHHQFLSVLDDAFQMKGNGVGTTYRGNLPFLRLDRIYVDPKLEIQDFETLDYDYSDHNPIITTIKY